MNTNNYMETLGNKIKEAQRQLSPQAQRYIDSCDDLYMGLMSYTYEIESRYFINDSDDVDYNISLNMMHLIDMMMEFMYDDDDYEDFSEDVIIEIDED